MNRLNLYGDEPPPKSILPSMCESLNTAFRFQGLKAEMLDSGEIKIVIGCRTAWIGSAGKLTGEANSPETTNES
jgi:hypothetical protein